MNPKASILATFLIVIGPLAMGVAPISAAPAVAHTQVLPDGFEILDRCVEAIGGEKAYRAHTSEQMSGIVRIATLGVEGTIVVRRQASTRTQVTFAIEGLGKVVQGTNGEVAWTAEAGQPARILEGEQAQSMINEANFYAPVEPRKTYTSAKTIEKVIFEGVECYKLELVTRWGAHHVGLFEVESGLHRKTSTRASADSDLFTTETVYSDYRRVDGVKRPHRLEVSAMGISQVFEFDEIEFDVKFDKDIFEPPNK